ncbi:MAG: sulfatase [Candidatus Binatia bacterium]|nr:sulfatase [Candidatus Binatia bacterium]
MKLRAWLMRALASSLIMGCVSPPAAPPEKPGNIFVIVVDTLRRDHVSAYGSKTRTPNIDRVATRGQVLTESASSFHQTTMSTAALFTGRTPSLERTGGQQLHWSGQTWCGLARLAASEGDDCIPEAVSTLAEEMRKLGYRTVGVIANELLYKPGGYEKGFDEWVQVAPRTPEQSKRNGPGSLQASARRRSARPVNAAVLKALESQPKDRPLFVYVHYIDVHEYQILSRSYSDAVRIFDADFGLLLDDLEKRGYLDDAMVVLTSDHGEALGETHALPSSRGHFGNPSFEPLLQVPLLASGNLVEDPSAFVRSQDLYGLLLRAAGAPELPASQDTERGELFLSELAYQTYRSGRWKSTRPRDGRSISLFDLSADPGETNDVAAAHPAIVAKHQNRIDQLETELSAADVQPRGLSASDEDRLRQLGYVE